MSFFCGGSKDKKYVDADGSALDRTARTEIMELRSNSTTLTPTPSAVEPVPGVPPLSVRLRNLLLLGSLRPQLETSPAPAALVEQSMAKELRELREQAP